MSSDVVMTDAPAATSSGSGGSSSINLPDSIPATMGGVDEALYSRQLYVFGHEAQQKMQATNVLIAGLKGLGVEIAKNVILAGVKSVGLLDATPVQIADLGAQFYLTEQDIGKPRASVSSPQLQSLNPYVNVHTVDEGLSPSLLSSGRYQILVLSGVTSSEALEWNGVCRSAGVKFVWAEVPGVYASIFVDFPPSKDATGEAAKGHFVSDPNGEQPLRGLIAHVSSSNPGVVTMAEETRHGLQDGDWVTFEEVSGMVELNASEPRQVKVLTPYSFSIEDTTNYTPYSGTKGYFQQVKRGCFIPFQPMKEVLMKDVAASISNNNWGNEFTLHALTLGLGRFRTKHGRLPRVDTWDDAREVLELSKAAASECQPPLEGLNEWALLNLARVSSCELNPLCAFMGGIAAQEVLKGASSKFMPIQQFYYYDESHVLPSEEEQKTNPINLADHAPINSRYDSQIGVFGRALQQKLERQSYFVVGAGAIGCEMVKNFAMMGLATAAGARVTITDMDTIERSNLNRQFLFRNEHVGKMKSLCAAEAVKKMNNKINIVAHSNRVAPQTEATYDDAFWESLDGVVTALDNVEARLYVDQRCIYYQKPMVDSGTLGTKGSTQVVVPFLTESYGSTRDAPEESIPICTLKNFPHKIEHTIQWARDHFEGLFKAGPAEVNNYLTQPNYLEELAKQPNVQLQSLQTVKSYLIDEKPASFEDCVRWARMVWEKEYHYNIAQLLHNFPPDSTTDEGAPFWSGSKRPPTPLKFDRNDPLHINFILAAANLRAFNYHIPQSRDRALVSRIAASVEAKPFVPVAGAKIATSDAEAKQMLDAVEDDLEVKVRDIIQQLPQPSKLEGFQLQAIEFEKDDDSNFHMDFITACSNLRARNYAIKELDRHGTKFTAGKIIPAIATTTALVTGMVCMELYKLIQPSKNKIEDFRCFSCNLALPLFSSSEPMPPAKTKIKLKGEEWQWSLWDRLEVDEGDITLEQLMRHMKSKYGLEVTMLSHGPTMIYYDFGMGIKKKVKDRLKEKMSDLVRNVANVELKPNDKYLVLEVSVQNEEEEEVEVPYIRFKFRQ